MKRHLIICTALLLILLTACSRQPGKTAAQDLTVIDLETALKNPQGEMKLSDLYTSVRYVPKICLNRLKWCRWRRMIPAW